MYQLWRFVIIKMYEQLCNGEIVIESVEDASALSVKSKIDLLRENVTAIIKQQNSGLLIWNISM